MPDNFISNQDKEKYALSLFDLSVDMLCVAQFNGFFKLVNPAWMKTLGWTQEELLARPWIEFVYEQDRAKTLAVAEQIKGGIIEDYLENRYLCKDGSLRWILWNAVALSQDNLIFAVARDITEKKQTQEQLKKREEQYRQLVEDANSIIIRMDIEGRFTFVNEFAQKFFGYKQEELLGKSLVGTIIPKTDIAGQDLRLMLEDLLINPNKYLNNENENVLHNGRRVWVSWTNRPIFDEDGQLKEVLCVGNDITRLRLAQMELIKAKELAELASKASTVVCTPDWRIKQMNDSAKKYFNLDNISKQDNDFLKIMLSEYNASISKEQIFDLSKRRKSFDLVRPETEHNKALYLQVDMEVVINQLHEISGIAFVFQDVTELRQEELRKQNFLNLISHKLNTPVTVINQIALLFHSGQLGQLNDLQKKNMEKILDKAFQLNGLVKNLITFTTINSQNLELIYEPIAVAKYLPELVNIMIKAVKDKKIEFNLDCSDNEFLIYFSQAYFDLIISNLIDNAIKFNDKDIVKIDIKVKRNIKDIEISVTDNGLGIPPEEFDKIFNKFYQIERYFTGNVVGIGLGLSLVKHLVTGYGGIIRLESKLGEGSSFIIFLPIDSVNKAK